MTDLGALSGLLGGFQQRMQQLQQEVAALRLEAESGGGAVKVVVTGDGHIDTLSIDPSITDDAELLEDLIKAATNEALRQAEAAKAQKMATLTAGLPIPPGLIPGM